MERETSPMGHRTSKIFSWPSYLQF